MGKHDCIKRINSLVQGHSFEVKEEMDAIFTISVVADYTAQNNSD